MLLKLFDLLQVCRGVQPDSVHPERGGQETRARLWWVFDGADADPLHRHLYRPQQSEAGEVKGWAKKPQSAMNISHQAHAYINYQMPLQPYYN
jgi:hypothetical protein